MVLFWLVGDANRGIFYFAYKAYRRKSKIPEVPKEFASKTLHTLLVTTIFWFHIIPLQYLLNVWSINSTLKVNFVDVSCIIHFVIATLHNNPTCKILLPRITFKRQTSYNKIFFAHIQFIDMGKNGRVCVVIKKAFSVKSKRKNLNTDYKFINGNDP